MRLYLFIFLLGCSTIVSETFAAQANPDAAAKFTSQFKSYTSFKTLTVHFRQEKRLHELKKPLLSSGTLLVDRVSKKLRWQISEPTHLLVEIQGDKIRLESGHEPDIKRQSFDLKKINQESKSWKSLAVWMDFDPMKILKHYFVIETSPSTFQLEPKVADSAPFKKLFISASNKGHINRLEMIEASDDIVVFNFDPPALTK